MLKLVNFSSFQHLIAQVTVFLECFTLQISQSVKDLFTLVFECRVRALYIFYLSFLSILPILLNLVNLWTIKFLDHFGSFWTNPIFCLLFTFHSRSHLFLSHYIRTIISHYGRHRRMLLFFLLCTFCTLFLYNAMHHKKTNSQSS